MAREMPRAWLGAIAAALTVLPGTAHSQQQEILAEPELAKPPSWSAALDLHAGLGLLMNSETEHSHALAGGATRFRLGHFEFGGFAEYADFGAAAADSHSTHIGGLLGAFLPFHYWADLEGALGIGYRTYVDTHAIYGTGGYKQQTPTVSVRLGVSDRLGHWFGGTLGAQLFGSYDLKRADVPWRDTGPETSEGPIVRSGSRRVGGFTVGMLMTVGIDIGPYAEAPKPKKPEPPSGAGPAGWQVPVEPSPPRQTAPLTPGEESTPPLEPQPTAEPSPDAEQPGESPPDSEGADSEDVPAEPASEGKPSTAKPPEQPPSAEFPTAD